MCRIRAEATPQGYQRRRTSAPKPHREGIKDAARPRRGGGSIKKTLDSHAVI